MATRAAILFLVCFFNLTAAYVLLDDDENLDEFLVLPTEYYLKAERLDLIRDMKLPMELWFSMENNRSRVDVYDGMVRRYYYWGEDGATGTKGTIYMSYPTWTEKEGAKIFCEITDMENEPPVDAFPQDYVDYVYKGNTVHEGKKVDVWKFEEDDEDIRTEMFLYSYRTERGEDVPVQIKEKKFNKVKGSILKNIIINYDAYNPLFCVDDIKAENEGDCEWTRDDFYGHMKMLHPAFEGHLDKAFHSFKKHHGRDYQNQKEQDMRREVFHENWQFVVTHNQQNLSFKLALNHLSDLTSTERAHLKGGRASPHPSGTIPFPHSKSELEHLIKKIPEEYDMRLEGVISPVKNQGSCGSCWTFATAAAVEGAFSMRDGRILDLSEQSIIDCNWIGNNTGCSGGSIKSSLEHVMKYGLPLEDDYGGYLAENGYCHIEDVTEVLKISGFTLVTPRTVNAMKVALYKYGPVAISMQANDAFDFYSSGVFYDTTCGSLNEDVNHGMTIVGYGSRHGDGYWIAKNSWGQYWGQGGYILVSQQDNNCFVLEEPYYPVV